MDAHMEAFYQRDEEAAAEERTQNPRRRRLRLNRVKCVW